VNQPTAGHASTPGATPGRYPAELERVWQPAGRPAVRIRALRPSDVELELRFVEQLSPHTLYLRMQYSASQPTRHEIERLLDLDYHDRLAVTAVVADEADGERIVGVSRYARVESTTRAECAVVVADDWQGCGLGTELMRTLAQAAVERGYTCLEGTSLAENSRLVAWARRFGFEVRTEPHSGGQLRVTIELRELGLVR
jgi:acetyltransferase